MSAAKAGGSMFTEHAIRAAVDMIWRHGRQRHRETSPANEMKNRLLRSVLCLCLCTCDRLNCDVRVVVTLLCTHRVRLQKARVDKRQRKYAKFLGKWWKEEYGAVASADERKKATEVIETVFLFFFFCLIYCIS